MSLLCPFTFPAGSWCRLFSDGAIVLWLPPGNPLPLGFAPWLRESGSVLMGVKPYRDGLAVRLRVPQWLRVALQESIPEPMSHGSKTAGNDLRW